MTISKHAILSLLEKAPMSTVFLCVKCGYGSEEHGLTGHPAFQCVADMRLVPAARLLTEKEPSNG